MFLQLQSCDLKVQSRITSDSIETRPRLPGKIIFSFFETRKRNVALTLPERAFVGQYSAYRTGHGTESYRPRSGGARYRGSLRTRRGF
jgi:hypothetical protein